MAERLLVVEDEVKLAGLLRDYLAQEHWLYVASFGSYNKTYGSLGAVISFLVWMWITNNVLLFGAEVNAELERGRELQAGQPAQEDIQLPHRRPPKD